MAMEIIEYYRPINPPVCKTVFWQGRAAIKSVADFLLFLSLLLNFVI